MGTLDDAIREHLELKRRLGASDDEIEREGERGLRQGHAPRAGRSPAAAGPEPGSPPRRAFVDRRAAGRGAGPERPARTEEWDPADFARRHAARTRPERDLRARRGARRGVARPGLDGRDDAHDGPVDEPEPRAGADARTCSRRRRSSSRRPPSTTGSGSSSARRRTSTSTDEDAIRNGSAAAKGDGAGVCGRPRLCVRAAPPRGASLSRSSSEFRIRDEDRNSVSVTGIVVRAARA